MSMVVSECLVVKFCWIHMRLSLYVCSCSFVCICGMYAVMAMMGVPSCGVILAALI